MSKIIAEIGVNWNGDINTAKHMIIESKLSGADYVKFQLFDKSIIKDSEHYHTLKGMVLGSSELHELKSYADEYNIGFIVSCMYPESFALAKQVKPDFIKIRNADRKNDELAKLAIDYCNEINTKVLVSTELFNDISCIYILNQHLCRAMYCIPKYPPNIKDAISIMRHHSFLEGFEMWRGFSSHFRNVLIPALAASIHMEFIEVHVSCFISDIDRNVSLTFEQLKTLCDVSKGAEQ